MAVRKEFEWRNKALMSVYETAQYISDRLSVQAAENFVRNVYKAIDKICDYPTIGAPSKKFKTVRSIRIDDHRRLYYVEKGRKVILIALFDTRQDPSKNKY